VIDLSPHHRQITELNLEARTVRVGPGVVLDQLNDFLQPHGYCFGPDVATSSRATLGGMIANNSSGARAPLYGTTADHIVSLDVILPNGTCATAGAGQDGLTEHRDFVDALVTGHADLIRERMPEGLVKRWHGYGLDKYLKSSGDLTQIISASEGTLAVVISAVLNIVPLPGEKALGVIFFEGSAEAMQATVEILDLQPAAIEHVDRVLFDQTRGQRQFKAAREMLNLDDLSVNSFLIVEFYGNIEEKLNALSRKGLGLRTACYTDAADMARIWALRKAGLSLLTGRVGPAKPIAGLEDVAVLPKHLPEYVAAFKQAVAPLGMETSFYGHAASGLLHVRPIVDLHKAEDIQKFRVLSDTISELVRKCHGSLAGEHGVGLARAEFMEAHLGPELVDVMRRIKERFDPAGVMNPGKVLPDGTFAIDRDLRQGADKEIALPFEPFLAFAFKDGCFVGNLEQCNGCGQCRKDSVTMCPTFTATGEEIMSTRGRANTIRAALEGRLGPGDPLTVEGLDTALDYCLSCRACTSECPSNVNLSLLKAELLHARHETHGIPFTDRMIAAVDLLGRVGCAAAPLANFSLTFGPFRKALEWVTGISAKRPLPLYTRRRFDKWFSQRGSKTGTRGAVVLWDDCFVRYNEPHVGEAAVKVLESAGFEVRLAESRQCCGRPAFSRGCLNDAKRAGEHNVAMFLNDGTDLPILFLEPSCYSMFAEDYRELGVADAETVARRCVTFEDFIFALLSREPDAICFGKSLGRVVVHGHCHAKALTDVSALARLADYLEDTHVEVLDTGCCGMAGAYGMMKDKYETSLAVAEPLIALLDALDEGTHVVASGTSCRHQISHLSKKAPVHMAEVLAMALA